MASCHSTPATRRHTLLACRKVRGTGTPVSTFSSPPGALRYTVSGPGAVASAKASRSESRGLNGNLRLEDTFTGDAYDALVICRCRPASVLFVKRGTPPACCIWSLAADRYSARPCLPVWPHSWQCGWLPQLASQAESLRWAGPAWGAHRLVVVEVVGPEQHMRGQHAVEDQPSRLLICGND